MKYKTAELDGALLDAAVAMAEGWTFHRNKRDGITVNRPDGSRDEVGNYPPRFDAETGLAVHPMSVSAVMEAGSFFPSTEWSQGGPIIERERIALEGRDRNGKPSEWVARGAKLPLYFGPMPLIAAMRCFVANKLGDEVEI